MKPSSPKDQITLGLGSTTFTETLRDSFDSMSFADISISCSDGQFPAHRSILSASSEFLRSLLENPDVTVIVLPEFKSSVLRRTLELFYTGEICFEKEEDQEEEAAEIIKILSAFGIPDSKLQIHQIPSEAQIKGRGKRKRRRTVSNEGGVIEEPIEFEYESNSCEPNEISIQQVVPTINIEGDDEEKEPPIIPNPLEFDHDYFEIKRSRANDWDPHPEQVHEEIDMKFDPCFVKIDSISSLALKKPLTLQTFEPQNDEEEEEEDEQEKLESARISSQKDHAYAYSKEKLRKAKVKKNDKVVGVEKNTGKRPDHNYAH